MRHLGMMAFPHRLAFQLPRPCCSEHASHVNMQFADAASNVYHNCERTNIGGAYKGDKLNEWRAAPPHPFLVAEPLGRYRVPSTGTLFAKTSIIIS